jgi:hypothetical protein
MKQYSVRESVRNKTILAVEGLKQKTMR